MESCLVAGGAGFMGSNFVRWTVENKPKAHVAVLDKRAHVGSWENLAGISNARMMFVHGDICDAELLEDSRRTRRTRTSAGDKVA